MCQRGAGSYLHFTGPHRQTGAGRVAGGWIQRQRLSLLQGAEVPRRIRTAADLAPSRRGSAAVELGMRIPNSWSDQHIGEILPTRGRSVVAFPAQSALREQ